MVASFVRNGFMRVFPKPYTYEGFPKVSIYVLLHLCLLTVFSTHAVSVPGGFRHNWVWGLGLGFRV